MPDDSDQDTPDPLADQSTVKDRRGDSTSLGPDTPDRIGPYKVLEVLGEGGFGIVYLAEQTEPVKRKVALKVIKPGMDSRQVIARFEAERQALAMMDHPNVARVFDAGTTDEQRPYFVMEHVPGVPITDHCDRQRLSIDERLDLFMLVCEAVQHAHQKGIIHRDIKPSNVLVSVRDGQDVPKVIDFGVAKALHQKLTEKTLFTEQGQLVGTPEYMSPEQAEMTAQDIDTRSDIYSLGVLLYELLTGALPFDPESLRAAAFGEIQRIIREQEPPKPSTRLSSLGDDSATSAKQRRIDPRSLERELRGDLDWIVMKALEKDRTRRYETATSLAEDIRRHLNHEPVLAGPPSAAYRISKFVQRNRTGVFAGGIVAAALIVGTVVSITFALQAESARGEALANLTLAEKREQEAKDATALARRRERDAQDARDAAAIASQEAQDRADEFEVLAEFQEEQLSGIDVWLMGDRLRQDILSRRRAALEARGSDEDAIERSLSELTKSMEGVNFTNVALDTLDENIFQGALAAIETQFGGKPRVKARLLQAVATTLFELGMWDQAEAPQKSALQIRRNFLGDDHPDTLQSMNAFGDLLTRQQEYDEAEKQLGTALEGRRRTLGDIHPDTLSSINSFGLLLSAEGKYAEAEEYYREAVAGKRLALGDDHASTLISINNLASVLRGQKKLKEAKRYAREALEGMRRSLGDDHPRTLSAIAAMGLLLEAQGKSDEAETFDREAMTGRRRTLGDQHPETLSSVTYMAARFLRQGKLAEAESYYREALLGMRATPDDNQGLIYVIISNLGYIHLQMRTYGEAEAYFREALPGLRQAFGKDHPNTLTTTNSLGEALQRQGELSESEAYYPEALQGRRRTLGDNDKDTLKSMTNLGNLLRETGAPAQAEPYLREGLKGLRGTLGNEDINTLIAVHHLGAALRELGRLEEADALGAEAARGARATLAPLHTFRLVAIGEHGRTLVSMRRFAEAEAEFLEAHGGFSRSLGDGNQRTIRSIQSLADLYTAWNEAEPGKGYDAKAAQWQARLDAIKNEAGEDESEDDGPP